MREQADAIAALPSRHDHRVVRYEDLCADPSLVGEVREFVSSPVTGDCNLRGGADRKDLSKHGGAIDRTRVGLFAQETDEIARHDATYLFEEMADYNRRYGYRFEG